MADQIDRAVVREWLTAQLAIWPNGSISPEHLLKHLISDVPHLPATLTEDER